MKENGSIASNYLGEFNSKNDGFEGGQSKTKSKKDSEQEDEDDDD